MKNIKLSIIIPCYNEEKNIPLILDRFEDSLKDAGMLDAAELILVDNNSKDNSASVIKAQLSKKKYSFAKTVFQPVPGYGAALQKGFKAAQGEYVCWTHGDIQTPPDDVAKAYKLILKQENPKKSFIKGDRHGRPLFDQFFTWGMSLFESAYFGMRLWDINAQPNLFHRSFMGLWKNPPSDFSFDLYILCLASRNDYTIIRFPVYFGKRLHGESSWNTSLSGKWKFIKRTLKFSIELKKRLK
jgi:glycosyltransferase involved in cell wall biosynthesis